MLVRSLLASLLVLALAAPALAWRFSYGSASANRVAAGQGTFPRVVVISTPAEAPFRWVVSMPQKRLAAIDANGTLWIFEIAQTSLAVIGRYGDAASPDGPPVSVSLGDGRPGIVCVSREGLLLVWQAGALQEEQSDPPGVEHDREDRFGGAFGWTETDRQRVVVVVHDLHRAR